MKKRSPVISPYKNLQSPIRVLKKENFNIKAYHSGEKNKIPPKSTKKRISTIKLSFESGDLSSFTSSLFTELKKRLENERDPQGSRGTFNVE